MLKDRILAIIDHYGITANKFSEKIGMSRAFVKNMNDEISTKPLRNILLMFPDINIKWLITGEGEMLLENANLDKKIELTERIPPNILIDYLKEKDKIIGDLREEIGTLKRDLESAQQGKRIDPMDINIRNVAEEPINYSRKKK
ncbi:MULTISPECIES: hypothetical protein [unclassified Dysgonomonas]|uniref:hypothetical protein n=1 Tax=unclassified Dysgonomonas TaxID=2630389 RepID=UPI0025BB880A|nr:MULTISPECIES: hypothetical protein [unclassified Dysgonomonas]HMM02000.1 hypothetical protein [Dysgonomonas sp.]